MAKWTEDWLVCKEFPIVLIKMGRPFGTGSQGCQENCLLWIGQGFIVIVDNL